MTKSTWREDGDVGSEPKRSEQVKEVQELRGNYHIGQSLSVDHLERAFAEVSLTEKYDCKKVVLDIGTHQCLKKTNHEIHSLSEIPEGKHGPQMEEPQKKQEEDTVGKHDKPVEDPKKNGDIKGNVSGQEDYDRVREYNKNEKCLSSILASDGDDYEDESSDEEDQGPLITVKLEDIVKDKSEAPCPKQGPNKIDSVHMTSSTVIPKVIPRDSSAHQPQKESYQKDKAFPQISEEVKYRSQKATEDEENITVEKEDDVKEENKAGIVDREKKNGKFSSTNEEKVFSIVAEDEGGDDESSDEEDQKPLITVKLEDEVKDDTDEAYLERGPSKGGSVHLRYSPMTPRSHGLGMHGSHGLHLRPSSTAGGEFYPSAHMSGGPRHGISAGPYNIAVTPSTHQSASSSGSLAGLLPPFENTTFPPVSYANVSPQREGTTTVPLGCNANKYPLCDGTSTLSPGSCTSASPQYEGTPALSPGSYTSASPLYEGTPALSPGSYTNASPLYEGTPALSPGSYIGASPLYEGTSSVSPGSFTNTSPHYEGTSPVSPGSYPSTSPLYECTPAVSQESFTSTSPLYEGIYALSPLSYPSASPIYEDTSTQSPSLYRSSSPSYEGIGKAGLQDDLETHTDFSADYANINGYGGLIGGHSPELPTPYMTPPYQAVQPTQVCSQALGQQNSIEEVLEVRRSVITQADDGEVEADLGEFERHCMDQLLTDIQSIDGGEFEDLPGLNDANFETFSGENQSPYPGGPRVNNPCVGKRNNGYKNIKPKTPPKILSLPQQEIQRRMCETSLDQICREMTSMMITNKTALYCVERDGETCLTRILKQSADSENFYENIYVIQEFLKRIQMCCDMLVDSQHKQCSRCGQGNAEEFYTPLSVYNREGKCGLTIAVEKNHPIEVVNYLCSGIEECRKDLQRAFNQQARQIFAHNITSYPVFGKFLSIKK